MDGQRPQDEGHPEPEPPKPLFHPPEAPPIPELLRTPVKPPAPLEGEGSAISGMTKAWGVAMDFVFTILGSALLGYFADRWFQTSPRYTLIGLTAGFTLALVRIIRRTMADERREQDARRKH